VYGSYRHVDANTGVSRTAAQLAALARALTSIHAARRHQHAQPWVSQVEHTVVSRASAGGILSIRRQSATTIDAISEHAPKGSQRRTRRFRPLLLRLSDRVTTRIGASFNDKRRDTRDPGIDGPLRIVYSSTIASGGRLLGTAASPTSDRR